MGTKRKKVRAEPATLLDAASLGDLAACLELDELAGAMVARMGARLDVRSAGGEQGALFQGACQGALEWLARRCVAEGVDPADASGAAAFGLHWIALGSRVADPRIESRVAMIDWLIELGCDPNLVERGELGLTPLHVASRSADVQLRVRPDFATAHARR